MGRKVSGTEFIVRVQRPQLSEQEYERRMEGIKQAAANLLCATEAAYIKSGKPFPEYLREFVGEEAYLASHAKENVMKGTL